MKTPKKQQRQPGIEATVGPAPEYIKPNYRGSVKLRDNEGELANG